MIQVGGMKMKIVTFCGHRDNIITKEVEIWLINIVEQLIQSGATVFYLGGYGAFDTRAAWIVHQAKQKCPQVESVLVTPYLNFRPDPLCHELYDSLLYPPLESVPRRLAILRRNKWMAEQCDILVAFLERRTGGAYQTFQWAEKRQKTIIQYPNNPFTV